MSQGTDLNGESAASQSGSAEKTHGDSGESRHADAASDRFLAEISDENFNFRQVRFGDRKVTGAQVADAAGAHPVEEFVVLQQLENYELETIRPTELVDISRPVRFFVIRGSGTDRFLVDGLNLEWPIKIVTGSTIKRLAGKDDEDVDLLLELSDAPDRIIGDDEQVRIGREGVERFKTRPAKGPLIIEVDGEPYEAPRRIMTPNEIIRGATSKDPANHYLVQITKHERISYKDRGDEPIRLRRGTKFQVICTGPMPVSDPQHQTGVQAFMNGLRQLGYAPAPLAGHVNHIVFDYVVESGSQAGKTYRLGFVVPADFPMNAPTGPYLSPEVHAIRPEGGPHPKCGVHKDQARVFEQAGGFWQYWSRPFPNWQDGKRSVATYMSHIWKLWDSQ